jgi:hypothetical protein
MGEEKPLDCGAVVLRFGPPSLRNVQQNSALVLGGVIIVSGTVMVFAAFGALVGPSPLGALMMFVLGVALLVLSWRLLGPFPVFHLSELVVYEQGITPLPRTHPFDPPKRDNDPGSSSGST